MTESVATWKRVLLLLMGITASALALWRFFVGPYPEPLATALNVLMYGLIAVLLVYMYLRHRRKSVSNH